MDPGNTVFGRYTETPTPIRSFVPQFSDLGSEYPLGHIEVGI